MAALNTFYRLLRCQVVLNKRLLSGFFLLDFFKVLTQFELLNFVPIYVVII